MPKHIGSVKAWCGWVVLRPVVVLVASFVILVYNHESSSRVYGCDCI